MIFDKYTNTKTHVQSFVYIQKGQSMSKDNHNNNSKHYYDQLITQTGEATGHYGQECPSCGRHPRIPYVNYQEWPQEKT